MYLNFAIIGIVVFVYSAIAGRVERSIVSGPIVFTMIGVILGPVGLDWLDFHVKQEDLRTLAELTLAMVLFTDAANADLSVLRHAYRIPQRLLLVGLPLTIALGCGLGALFFPGLGLLEVALLATMLAPTDAALGLAVVTNKAVPAPVREGLNVESGLNDGICVPILFTFLALAVGTEENAGGLAVRLVAEEIGIGVAVGLALTFVGVRFLALCSKQGWITETWSQLPVASLALCCFAVAQWLGGSGFIAAFAGGLLGGALGGHHKHRLLLAAEGTGSTLALITWVLFGAAVVGQSLGQLGWQVIVFSLLSLTLIRMLPVYLSLRGLPMGAEPKLFIGWFGPRGLASVVFLIIVINADLPGGQTLASVVVCTVVLSILLHGVSANPLVQAFAQRMDRSLDCKR